MSSFLLLEFDNCSSLARESDKRLGCRSLHRLSALNRHRRWSELLSEVLRPETRVDIATATLKDVLEGRPEVAIEPGVDDRIEETVGVSEPEEQTVQPVGNARIRITAEWLDECEDEEGQPAGSERPHDHPEGLGRLALRRRR